MTYRDVASLVDLKPGAMTAVEVDGERVLLSNLDGVVHAVQATCTHERAFLDEGMMDGGVVYCPLHFSSFDLTSGSCLGPPAEDDLRVYAVKIENDRILVDCAGVEEPVDLSGGSAGSSVAEQGGSDDPMSRPADANFVEPGRKPLLLRLADDSAVRTLTERTSHIVSPIYQRLHRIGLADLLHGSRWLGHSLHPAASDLPIGFWTSSVVLYLLGMQNAAFSMTLAGIAAAIVTVVSGFADWAVSDGRDRRVGLIHGLLNLAGMGLQVISAMVFLWGSVVWAGSLAGVGTGVTLGAAYLGGHLVLGRGVMVDHTAWTLGPVDWLPIISHAELQQGTATPVAVAGREVLLYRSATRVHAIEAACSHAGAALGGGSVAGTAITCPWHGSVFDLCSGAVLKGPATHAQPTLETRVVEGTVEVRKRRT